MQKWCPDCGRLNSRWPQFLMVVAFSALLIVSSFDSLRGHWFFSVVSAVASLMFFIANIALEMRNDSRRGDEPLARNDRRLD
jgi:uncharacterized membrane protein